MTIIHQFRVVLILLILIYTSDVMADDVERMDSQRRFLLTGMRAEREKLRSGQVVITGEHWRTTPKLGMQRLSVRFDVYFDHDARTYRYTQRDYEQYATEGMEPQLKMHLLSHPDLPRGTTTDGVEWVSIDYGGTVVHTPEYDLHKPNDRPHVTRLAPGTATGTAVREWDLASLGLVDWESFDRDQSLGYILDAYETRLTCHSVETTPSGLTCLKLHADFGPQSESIENEIWINEKQGMTPVRISRNDINDNLKEMSRCDVDWKEIHGAMVPMSFRINTIHQPDYTEGYDLTLDWSHVNEPLDPQVFTPAGITESKGALVADMRLGPVVMERVNAKPLPDMAGKQPAPPARPPWFRWVVLANIALFGLAWWFYRRRTKPTA